MALNYNNTSIWEYCGFTEEESVKSFYKAVVAGAAGVDMQSFTFHARSRDCFCGEDTKVESYPHHWTHHDDCRAILEMIATNRIHIKSIVSRVVKPETAPDIYTELCNNKDFPMGTVFDWR